MEEITLRDLFQKIQFFIDSSQFNQAIFYSLQIIDQFPRSIKANRLLGKAMMEKQKFDQAERIFSALLHYLPDDIDAHMNLATILEDRKDFVGAILHLERILEIEPKNKSIQGEISRLKIEKEGEFSSGFRLSRPAMVRMYMKGGLYQQALAEIWSILEKEPDRLDLEVLAAQIHLEQGQPENTKEICEKILNRHPYNWDANRLMMKIEEVQNDSGQTSIYKTRLIEMDPYFEFIKNETGATADIDAAEIILNINDSKSDSNDFVFEDWSELLNKSIVNFESFPFTSDIISTQNQLENMPSDDEQDIAKEIKMESNNQADDSPDGEPIDNSSNGWASPNQVNGIPYENEVEFLSPFPEDSPDSTEEQTTDLKKIDEEELIKLNELISVLDEFDQQKSKQDQTANPEQWVNEYQQDTEPEPEISGEMFDQPLSSVDNDENSSMSDSLADFNGDLESSESEEKSLPKNDQPMDDNNEVEKEPENDQGEIISFVMQLPDNLFINQVNLDSVNDKALENEHSDQLIDPDNSDPELFEDDEFELPDWIQSFINKENGEAIEEEVKENPESFTPEESLVSNSISEDDKEIINETVTENPEQLIDNATDSTLIEENVLSPFPEEADDDDLEMKSALAWLEGLALKHGAEEETLSSKPEERLTTIPDWLLAESEDSESKIDRTGGAPEWLKELELESIQENETFSADQKEAEKFEETNRGPVKSELQNNASDSILKSTNGEIYSEFDLLNPMDSTIDEGEITQPIKVKPKLNPNFILSQEALNEGRIDDSVAIFNQLISEEIHLDEIISLVRMEVEQNHPSNLSLWNVLGDAYLKNNQTQQALEAYSKAENLI